MPTTHKVAPAVIDATTPAEKEAFLLKINKAKHLLHFVSFAKKGTGSTRNMVFCMPGAIPNSGKPTPYDRMINDMKTNTLTVWDVNKGGTGAYRRINLEDIYSIFLDEVEYTINY